MYYMSEHDSVNSLKDCTRSENYYTLILTPANCPGICTYLNFDKIAVFLLVALVLLGLDGRSSGGQTRQFSQLLQHPLRSTFLGEFL